MALELYDCALRDGEQAVGASFSQDDRLELFKLLDDFGFDYIELGWPIVSKEIVKAFHECKKHQKNSKISAFGSTAKGNPERDLNLLSILESQPDVACIFGKTSLSHVKYQLKISPEENLRLIQESIGFLRKNGLPVFYDAEHFFDGFLEDKDYSLQTLLEAKKAGAERLVLCDTNGGTSPQKLREIVKATYEFLRKNTIDPSLGLHLRNDGGNQAPQSCLGSLDYIVQVQGTINGMGERVGNLDFSSFLPLLKKTSPEIININLKKLKKIHDEACRLSGTEINPSKPFVGDYAFAHKGGVHIDALVKGGASYEAFNPEDYGNERKIVLNSLGGSASILDSAKRMGIDLDKRNPEIQERIRRVYSELKELEGKGYRVGILPAEHYLLIAKYFGNYQEFFSVDRIKFDTEKQGNKEISQATLEGKVQDESFQVSEVVKGGPIDAFYKALYEVLVPRFSSLRSLKLLDYHASIAKRRQEESTMMTEAEFSNGIRFKIAGVNNNIIYSGTEAIEKGFRYHLNRQGQV